MPRPNDIRDRREYINLTGRVATLSEAVAFAIEQGFYPRVLPTDIPSFVHVRIDAVTRESAERTYAALCAKTWPAVYSRGNHAIGERSLFSIDAVL